MRRAAYRSDKLAWWVRRTALLVGLSVAMGGAQVDAEPCGCAAPGRPVAMSSRFVVYSYPNGPSPESVLDASEGLYKSVCRSLFGQEPAGCWETPCQIVLHADRASYSRAVRGGAGSVGSTWIRMVAGRIVGRRIDLLAESADCPRALAHELTHLALANYWPEGRPPRWLDEGLALLADGPEKQRLHWQDGQVAVEYGAMIRLNTLLTDERPLRAEQIPAFYGQSLSLVSFLLEHNGEPQQLLRFAVQAEKVGYDRALQECYGIAGVQALEQAWVAYVRQPRDPGRTVGIASSLVVASAD
ncbi:MAG: hypothetical protein KatS3mg110_3642 [Pirellulaceae bacterium]|nr:MAG: hypothetical protein KatS3mg110_3642 [Pirellulaceae bacterium]